MDEHFVLEAPHEDLNDSTSADEDFFETCCSIERYETVIGNSRKMRRSMSIGNLVMFSEQKGQLLQEPTCKVIKENESTGGLSEARSKSTCKGSMDQLNKRLQPKQYGSYDNLKKLNQNKFVSVCAEPTILFQNCTPERFRVKAPVHTKPALQKCKIKANPVNKKILQGPACHSTPILKPTKPITPTFMKNYRPRVTKPEPFSFADRDKLVTEKRKKLIQKILEEERRAREFHANPIPKSTYKSGSKSTSVARERRLVFEEHQRHKMDTMRNLELQREELKKATEKEEYARLRKLAETKARPIPNFKPMEIHSSDKKLTEPKSPNFRKINKENFPSNN